MKYLLMTILLIGCAQPSPPPPKDTVSSVHEAQDKSQILDLKKQISDLKQKLVMSQTTEQALSTCYKDADSMRLVLKNKDASYEALTFTEDANYAALESLSNEAQEQYWAEHSIYLRDHDRDISDEAHTVIETLY